MTDDARRTTLHDQTYRRYSGTRLARGSAWGVIASTGLRGLVRKKFFLVVMLFSWAQFVVRAVMLYLAQLEDWPDAPAIIANELAIYPAVTLAWGFRSAAIEYINGVRAFSTPLTR